MNRQVVLKFGRGPKFSNGQLSHYPGVLFKTHGVGGVIQPFNMYVQDHVRNAFIEKTQLTSPKPDETNVTKKLISTEYMKGHGVDSSGVEMSEVRPDTVEISEEEIASGSGSASTSGSGSGSASGSGSGSGSGQNTNDSKKDHSGLAVINEAAKHPVKISEQQLKRKLETFDGEKKKKKKTHKFNLI